MYDVQQDHWADALDKIDRVPAANRSKDLQNFRDRIQSRGTTERAKRFAAQGNKAEAVKLLTALYTSPTLQPDERRIAVYDLYQMGERQVAFDLARQQMAKGGRDGAKAGIDLAKLLSTDHQYDKAMAVVNQVQASGQLSGDDLDDLLSVKVLLVSMQVDKLIAAHDLARAYDEVAPLYAARPNDPSVLTTIGRIYAAGGRDTEAMQYFDKAFQQDSSNIYVIRAVVSGAIQAHEYDDAENYLSKGAEANPKNPWIFYLKGQLAHARGNNEEALDDLRTAQQMAKEQGLTAPSESAPAAPTQPELPPNPFRSSENSASSVRRLIAGG
jgi:tetratricopeptide (TPR) repeat protein